MRSCDNCGTYAHKDCPFPSVSVSHFLYRSNTEFACKLWTIRLPAKTDLQFVPVEISGRKNDYKN